MARHDHRHEDRREVTMDLLAAITNGSTAFILFTVMVIAIFITLFIVISR
jgi:hypothetical protein